MMKQGQLSSNDFTLWSNLRQAEMDFFRIRWDFLSTSNAKELVISQALKSPSDRATALRIILYLEVEERLQFLDELVDLASVGHSDISLVREVLLSLPKDFLLANIEKSAEPLLINATTDAYEEYRRLLELYIDIDRDLTRRLALRASESDDEDIREAGEDFLALLVDRNE
jgi:hypothetical protein